MRTSLTGNSRVFPTVASDRSRRRLSFAQSTSSGPNSRTTRAGTPATIVYGGTSAVTTLPAPTIANSPTVTPARIVLRRPRYAPRRIVVRRSARVASSPSSRWKWRG